MPTIIPKEMSLKKWIDEESPITGRPDFQQYYNKYQDEIGLLGRLLRAMPDQQQKRGLLEWWYSRNRNQLDQSLNSNLFNWARAPEARDMRDESYLGQDGWTQHPGRVGRKM